MISCRGGNTGLPFRCLQGHDFKISIAKLQSIVKKSLTPKVSGDAWCLKCRNSHFKCKSKVKESGYKVLSEPHVISEFKVECHNGHVFEAISYEDNLSPGFVSRGIEWCSDCFARHEAERIKAQKQQQILDEEHARNEQKRLF